MALCWGGVVPINGGGGSDSGFSVTPPPRPSPRFGSLQAEATAVSPRGGGGVWAHPKIEPPSHSQREPPSPPRPLHSAEFPPLRGGTIWGWGT